MNMDLVIEISLFVIFIFVACIIFVIKSARVVCLSCGNKHTASFKVITAVSPGNILFRDWFKCDKERLWYYRDILRAGNTPVNSDIPWILTYVDPVSDRALAQALETHKKLNHALNDQ